MVKHISSYQNNDIKQILNLQEKARERKKIGLFVVEGAREIKLALSGGYKIEQLYIQPEIFLMEQNLFLKNSVLSWVEISADIYKKIAYRDSTEGVIALFQTKDHSMQNLHLASKNPLILVAESPEKPGNIGALLRTSDAAGIDAFILANPTTDFYNPNVIRSSVGGVFTNNIASGTTSEIIAFLKKNKIQMLTTAFSENAENYLDQDFNKPTAIVIGTESTGLTTQWIKESDKNMLIPMKGKIDSMNVSVAAGILIFEAIRQRSKN